MQHGACTVFCCARSYGLPQPTRMAVKQHRLPPSVVPRRSQVLCPYDRQYRNPMQVPKLGSKMPQYWTYICLIQALGFPCSVCKDLSSDRALQISKCILLWETQEQRGSGGNLTFSLLFWGSSTGRAQPAALLLHPGLYRWLVWRRDCNARRDEWYLPSSLSRLQCWPISAS